MLDLQTLGSQPVMSIISPITETNSMLPFSPCQPNHNLIGEWSIKPTTVYYNLRAWPGWPSSEPPCRCICALVWVALF